MTTRTPRAALAALAIGATLLTSSAAEAGCTRPDHIIFFDPTFNTRIDIAPSAKTVEFLTGDGQTLKAVDVNVVDDGRHLTGRYSVPKLTIEFRADLSVGRVRARAIEIRDPLPDPRPPVAGAIKRKPRPYSKIWTVTLFGGRSQEGECGNAHGPGSS